MSDDSLRNSVSQRALVCVLKQREEKILAHDFTNEDVYLVKAEPGQKLEICVPGVGTYVGEMCLFNSDGQPLFVSDEYGPIELFCYEENLFEQTVH